MCMRSKLGCGTLDAPILVLPVSLLLKRRRSARGAGLQRQRAPGRPCGPARVLLRRMQTYDMYIPVIYLWYPLDQWCQPICLGCVFGMHSPMCAGFSLFFWLFKRAECQCHIWPTYSAPNQSCVRYNPLQWFQHYNFKTDYLASLQASIQQCTRPMEWIYALKTMKTELLARRYIPGIYTWHI